MPSSDPTQRFEDILENISLIEAFTAGMTSAEYVQDSKTNNAVERCLERISEAARKLGEAANDWCPAVSWAELRALGNLLRHEYDKVEVARIWLMIEDDLVPLKLAVQAAHKRSLEKAEE